MKTAVAIRHIAFEDLGTFEDVLLAKGFQIRYLEAGRDDLSALDAPEPDLLVLLGGPIGAYEEHLYPFLRDEMRLAEQRLRSGRPLLGICLGAQVMARALGSRVYPGRAKEIGWTPLSLTEAGLSGPTAHLSPGQTNMLHWHGDTFDLPPGATLLASTPLTKNQVYAWGDGALAFQCHPEVRAGLIERWLVGHACELAQAGVSPTALREATAEFGPALEVQGRKCFEQWLAETGDWPSWWDRPSRSVVCRVARGLSYSGKTGDDLKPRQTTQAIVCPTSDRRDIMINRGRRLRSALSTSINTMTPKLELAAITDEFSPQLEPALDAMAAIGMTGVELRVVWGKNIIDLSDDEVARATDLVHAHGMHVISIASPLLKCVLPGGGDVDKRFQQDSFNSNQTIDDQPRLAERALKLCELTGAKIIRVFSYWRTVEPSRCHDAICKALIELGALAAPHGLIVGLENEHACNIGTASEVVKVFADVPNANVQLVWDPANMLVGGEEPFPGGYAILPKERIAHVHAKDCEMQGHKPEWGPLGSRHVDWKGQIAALLADGYAGAVSLETHWPGPGGDKMLGSVICGWNLRGLLSA